MNPRHVRLLFVPLSKRSERLNGSVVLPLHPLSNDVCSGRSAPDENRVKAVLVRDGRVAHPQRLQSCRAQRQAVRPSFRFAHP